MVSDQTTERQAPSPGPWSTGTDENAHIVYDAELGLVADTSRDDGDWQTEEANARLIAAAPTMLTACKMAAKYHGVGDVDPLYTARVEDIEHFLAAAIRKAEGGAS